MKKFFALMVTVAMLLVAGSAMAADPTISLSQTTLSIQAGGTAQTVTATTTAGHPGGVMGAVAVSGADWVTVSGTTITVAPDKTVTPRSYPVTVTAVETYTDNAAGHSSTATATATATLNVTVTQASAGTTVIVKVVEVVTEVTKSVTVISQVAQRAAVVQTFTETVRTVSQTVTVAVLTQVEGYDNALATVWQAKSETIERETTAAISVIATNPTRRAQVFPGLPAAAVVTPQPSTALVAATSTTTTTMTVTQKLAVATASLGGAGKALSAQEAVKATVSGTYSFNKTFGKTLWKTKIGGHKGQRTKVKAGSFSAAAADSEGVAFVNSKGDVVTEIPGDESADVMPGFVTMLVVMNAGETYEPVVYATETDLAANGVSVDRAPTTVTYNEVTEEEKEVVVTVDENGNVTETVVEEASADVVSKITTAMGGSAVMVPTSAIENVTEATITVDDSAAATDSVHVAARMPAFKNLSNGTYYFPITFKPLGVGVTAGNAFEFYPDGYSAGTTAFAMVFDDKGNEITNPASVLAATSSDVKGYVAFEIVGGGIRVADADNTLANPMLGVAITPVTPTPTPTPTSDDAVLADLVTKGYINSSRTILDAGFDGGKPSLSDYTAKTIKLNFDVDPTSWTIAVAGNGSIKASAIGTITNATARQATVQLTKSQITAGTHAVTLTVLPVSGTTKAGNTVSASLGNVEGNPGLVGVGSSSGGCSAGSAVLALALLGTFIASRKK
ncbi:MAG: hypothetical protein IJL18_07165 [Synergistaceae bacterium]|nr:hypothetical protein [Synergistaceae bacterium]